MDEVDTGSEWYQAVIDYFITAWGDTGHLRQSVAGFRPEARGPLYRCLIHGQLKLLPTDIWTDGAYSMQAKTGRWSASGRKAGIPLQRGLQFERCKPVKMFYFIDMDQY